MLRDFTYIDDIVEGVLRVVDSVPQPDKVWNPEKPDPSTSTAPYKIYNIGNSLPVKLMDFIQAIEEVIGHPLGFKPHKPIREGVQETVNWYRSFYHL